MIEPQPHLSVLIPWDPRTSCTWRKRHFDWLIRRYQELLYPVEVCVGVNHDEPFNRSKARNAAFRKSTGEMLLVADADTLFDAAQINIAVQTVRVMGSWVMPFGTYYNLTQDTTRRVLGGADWQDHSLRSTQELGLPPGEWEHKIEDSPGGLRVLSREQWATVGGFDERFIGWGFEDDAFRSALDVMVGPAIRLKGCDCYHLWHPVSPTDGFESPTIERNRKLFRRYQRATSPAMMKKVLP